MKQLKRLGIYGTLIALFASFFYFYGIVTVKYRVFPYEWLDKIKDRIIPPGDESYQALMEINGLWYPAKISGNQQNRVSPQDREILSKLLTLPYLQGYNPAPDQDSVTIYNKSKAWDGLNIYLSGHRPSAFLIDMQGKVLHQWALDFKQVDWPKGDIKLSSVVYLDGQNKGKQYWRIVHPFDNGDILALYERFGIIKIDRNSKLIWANLCRAHHDIFVKRDGTIYTLTYNRIDKHAELELSYPIFEDYITIMNPQGQIIKSVSILKCFLNSEYRPLLLRSLASGYEPYDPFHTNSLEVLDGSLAGRFPMFKEGDILLSVSHLNAIAIADIEKETITWALTGLWDHSHDGRLLANGNIMLFDNHGNYGKSKVIEFNPLTKQLVWTYKGSNDDPIYSKVLGANQRLPNGNTLIIESTYGRTIEVTSQNEIVWEFLNPNRFGDNNELIATITDMIRIPADRVSWIK